MQRDAYASLIKYPKSRKVPLRVMQLNGKVLHENVMADFFRGYKSRRLALMTYTAGQDPRLPRLPRDIVVPSFEVLLKIHQPHFMYQLLPLFSADLEAFAALQSTCSAPGSPFTIRDRVESSLFNYHLSLLSSHREKICEFFKDDTAPSELLMPVSTRRLPVQAVVFQGILFSEKVPASAVQPFVSTTASASSSSLPSSSSSRRNTSGAVFVTTHESCSEAIIQQRALMTRLFRSALYGELVGNGALLNHVYASVYQWHVLAIRRRVAGGRGGTVDQRTRAHLVQLARKDNLLLCEKVDEGVYEYVQ